MQPRQNGLAAIAVTIMLALGCELTTFAADATKYPTTIKDALVRMEGLLGAYDSANARYWHLSIASEVQNQPESDKPPVLVANNGVVLIGTPYRTGDALSFDLNESVDRQVYELEPDGRRRLVRQQQRYAVQRYTLRMVDETCWEFDVIFTAHSNPRALAKLNLRGVVHWLADGVELIGVGTDRTYASEGRLIPVATHGRIKITRKADAIALKDRWQAYHMASDPDGIALPIPDFARPIGQANTWLTGIATLNAAESEPGNGTARTSVRGGE